MIRMSPKTQRRGLLQQGFLLYLGGTLLLSLQFLLQLLGSTTTELMDGIIRFHVYLTPAAPARDIEFVMEYDPGYISALFS